MSADSAGHRLLVKDTHTLSQILAVCSALHSLLLPEGALQGDGFILERETEGFAESSGRLNLVDIFLVVHLL